MFVLTAVVVATIVKCGRRDRTCIPVKLLFEWHCPEYPCRYFNRLRTIVIVSYGLTHVCSCTDSVQTRSQTNDVADTSRVLTIIVLAISAWGVRCGCGVTPERPREEKAPPVESKPLLFAWARAQEGWRMKLHCTELSC